VADNIAISNAPHRLGLIDRRAQRRMAEEALARAGADNIHPLALVKDLPLSRRQMVEIAKALARRPRILILDEATSALTAADVTKIYAVLKRLRAEGLALLYISHRMHEIAELADECTVFCNGRSVASYAAGTKTDHEVVALIPEDRKTEGLMLPMSVRENLSFAALGRLSRGGVVDAAAERDAVERIVRLLAVRTDGIDLPAGSLSGGNQQKLVIGKWLMM